MTTKLSFLIFVTMILILLIQETNAFDISAYFDGTSLARRNRYYQSCLQTCGDPDTCVTDATETIWASSIANNQQILQWYSEMGITVLDVAYRSEDYAGFQDSSMQMMNERYPNQMFKYLEAQHRIVHFENNQFNDSLSQWGDGVIDTVVEVSDGQFKNIIAIGSSSQATQADTMFRPGNFGGKLRGWTRGDITGQNNDNLMPMHFRVLADVIADEEDTTNLVAQIYWLVGITWGGWYNAGGRWVRYPALNLYKSDFSAPFFQPKEFRIDPFDTTFVILDEDFIPIPLMPTLNDYPLYHAFTQDEVQFCIYYRGHHRFFISEFEVWDEGYHRLFRALGDTISNTESAIVSAFSADHSHMRHAGWYYDEINNSDYIRSWVRVNKILKNNNLPTFYINGYTLDDDRVTLADSLIAELNDQHVQPQTFMNETYYFYGDSTGVGLWHRYPPFLYTKTCSDCPYTDTTCSWINQDDEGKDVKRFNGTQSLQRAIDWTYWEPPDSQLNPFLSLWQSSHPDDLEVYPGFFEQVRLHHHPLSGDSTKIWALLQAGASGPYDVSESETDLSDPLIKFSFRNPTANEIKLQAWMAVAGDADGIMWYWGIPSNGYNLDNGPYGPIGGLFAWNENSDFCSVNGATLDTTERYNAAKHVHAKIQQIAPIIEPLKFGGTVASYKFEVPYYRLNNQNAVDTTEFIYFPDTVNGANGLQKAHIQNIYTWRDSSGLWVQDNPNLGYKPYVQVSYWKAPNNAVENYYLLVVNRRALADETRKVSLEIAWVHSNREYQVDYLLQHAGLVAPHLLGQFGDYGRRIDVVLPPGEAELIHFYPLESICDTTLAHIDSLTAVRTNQSFIKLDWEAVTETDSHQAFQVDKYYICGSDSCVGPYKPIGYSTTTSYIDSAFHLQQRYFYTVQACGTVTE